MERRYSKQIISLTGIVQKVIHSRKRKGQKRKKWIIFKIKYYVENRIQ